MSILSRFQMRSGTEFYPEIPAEEVKHVREIKDITEPADILVMGKVVDLKYVIYEACPFRKSTKFFCGKKLDDKHHCAGCDKTSKKPHSKLYIYMKLQDLKQQEFHCHLAAFQPVAEAFLGLTIAQIKEMKEEQLATSLQAKFGFMGLFKIKAKKSIKKCYEHVMDLIMVRFRPLSKEELMEHEEEEPEEEEESQSKKKKVKNEEQEEEEEEFMPKKPKMGKKAKKAED